MKKIQISILNQGSINIGLVEFLKFILLNERRFVLDFQSLGETQRRPIEDNLNHIQEKFLKSDNDFLLLLNDDIVPQKNILDLVEWDKDIISGAIATWKREKGQADVCWLALRKEKDGYRQLRVDERNGLKEVDAVGSGCLLIKREVLKEIKPMSERLFDLNGFEKLGHDFNFCERAKEMGFKVWVHWEYPVEHFSKIGIIEVLKLLTK